MAKLRYFDTPVDTFAGIRTFESFFNAPTKSLVTHTETKAVFTDANGHQLIFVGTGLAYEDFTITGGTVAKVTIANAEGDAFVQVLKVSRDAALLFDALATDGVQSMFDSKILNGNDTIFGSDVGGESLFGRKGNDTIIGGDQQDSIAGERGKDKLTGGGAGDFFFFSKRDGSDVITDFDAKGGFGKQDLIFVSHDMFDDAKIRKSGSDDTLIDFGHGDTLTLRGVKPAEIDDTDFVF
jgi:Ca2+-binding RTX toxin-like protein